MTFATEIRGKPPVRASVGSSIRRLATLQNISIRLKVLSAFGAVLLTTVGLGWFAIDRLAVVNATAAEISERRLPAAQDLAELARTSEIYRITEFDQILAVRATDWQRAQARLAEALNARDAAWSRYAPHVSAGEERGLVDRYLAEWQAYLKLGNQLRRLAAVGDGGAAAHFFGTEELDQFAKVRALLAQDIELNAHEGNRAAAHSAAMFRSARLLILIGLLATAVLCIIFGLSIVIGVSRPIRRLSAVMGQLAAHDLSVAIDGLGRRDEIGSMAASVEVFRASMIEADRLAGEQATERRRKERRSEFIEGLARTFEEKVGDLAGGVAASALEMIATAASMSSTVEDTRRQTIAVSAAAGDASANVRTVVRASEQLAESVHEIGDRVRQSSRIAQNAVEEARRTDTVVRTLSEGAQRIGDIVRLIGEIAHQTSLLAMNATIEAARAGKAGTGFAVVASEVRSLANQTSKAAGEISDQISQIQGATAETVRAIQGIGGTISEMSGIATAIASAVEQQDSATRQIARNVEQAAAGTEAVSQNITGLNDTAHINSRSAELVRSAAVQLSSHAERLSAEVREFLVEMKVA